MKKLFNMTVSLAIGIFFTILGHAQAFDYMADVDEVTKDPHKAYTLYVGMPYNDAVANFKHLSGWQFYEEWKYFAFFQ